MFDLGEKTILFTGGTSRLGRSMAEGLASHGADVVITGRNPIKINSVTGEIRDKYATNSSGTVMDVSDEKSVGNAVEKIIRRYGKIDVLINGASYGEAGKPDEISFEAWKKGIDGTINNVFLCTRYVLPHMLEAGKGNIINIASMYGLVSPNPEVYGNSGKDNPANYGAGKAAILQYTRYLACYYGRKGIRVNAISPGPFPSEDAQKDMGFILNLSNKTALGRIGEPKELAGIAVFLASDESSYITGQNISVDGGWTAW